ncbi:MAG: HAMP domain-containing protein [Proteobacteria bacterium]|nr:HAMP domain-containing protein [Pseudomonadota bacterium]
MTSLRTWLVGALLVVVLMAVAGSTATTMNEVSNRLEEDLEGEGRRALSSLRAELQQTGAALDNELDQLLDPRGPAARADAAGGAAARYLYAAGRLEAGRVDLLKVLESDSGTILMSGHWPATLGVVDAGVTRYRTDAGTSAIVVDEPVSRGAAASLQRWGTGRWGSTPVVAVVGRFLDEDALERMRARLGVDLLALCRKGAPCLIAGGEELTAAIGASMSTPEAAARLSRHPLTVGQGSSPAELIVGLDRSPIEAVKAAIRRRALGVGSASVLLALAVGFFLAGGVVRPVEALARAAGDLAGGDLDARAETGSGRIGELEGLVDAFNSMADDIQSSQEKLVQAERVAAWREIARGLAHELRNPLTPIQAAMDVMRKARRLDRPDFDDILEEQAGAVIEEVIRLKKLSDSFAQFARLPDPEPEELDLAELVDRTVALYASGDEEVTIDRRYATALPAVSVDRAQIQTVVTNLVKNALEAMNHQGRLLLVIRTDDLEGRAGIELRVEDSGHGIPEDVRTKLFTPYFTTKGSRGTGLGLAMAHRIVLEHQGTIEAAESELGGAAFVIRLPVRRPSGAAPPGP